MAKIENPVVIVQSGGETLYYSQFNGAIYKEDMEIPAKTYKTTQMPMFRDCHKMMSFKCYATQFSNMQYYQLTENQNLKEVYLPFVTQTSGHFIDLYSKTQQDMGVLQLGSIGTPVISMHQHTFNNAYATGENWTVTIYVNAATIADIPVDVTQYSPWGANSLTNIVYRNSTTGEVIS